MSPLAWSTALLAALITALWAAITVWLLHFWSKPYPHSRALYYAEVLAMCSDLGSARLRLWAARARPVAIKRWHPW
jgi:hypothetical protein